MRFPSAALAVLCVCAGLHSRRAASDVVYMRDGKSQAGLITQNDAEKPSVTILTAAGELSIPRSKIDRVEPESKAASYGRVGDQCFDSRRYDDAAANYSQGLGLEPQNADLQTKLQKTQLAKVDAAKAGQRDSAVRLDRAIDAARASMKERKYDEAFKTLRAADPGNQSVPKDELGRVYSELYFQWGVDRLDRQDVTGAVEKLQMCLRIDPTNDTARQALVRAYDGDPTKLREVVEFYRNSQVPEEQIKMADACFKLRDYESALPVYLKYVGDPKYGGRAMHERIMAMFDMVHRQAADQGNYEHAIELYQKFLEYSPNEDKTPLAKYEYMRLCTKTNPGDPNARAEVARYAEEHGLGETAAKEYRLILSMAPDNPAAREGLKRFAMTEMQEAQAFYGDGQYLLTKNKTTEIEKNYAMFPDIAKTAKELGAKAEVEQQKTAASRQQQALTLATRGDEYYNQALSYLSMYTSKDYNPRTTVFSPKTEATKFLQRALYSWRTALSYDPSLGDPGSYDLYSKIADAQAKYSVLNTSAPSSQGVYTRKVDPTPVPVTPPKDFTPINP